jgi:hypothetical protein
VNDTAAKLMNPVGPKEDKRRENREFLVAGWDPESVHLRRIAAARGVGRRVEQVVPFHVDVDLAGTEGAATLALPGDGLQQGKAAASSLNGPESRRTTRPRQASIDVPEPVLGEVAVDHDDVGLDGHDPTVGREGRGSQP